MTALKLRAMNMLHFEHYFSRHRITRFNVFVEFPLLSIDVTKNSTNSTATNYLYLCIHVIHCYRGITCNSLLSQRNVSLIRGSPGFPCVMLFFQDIAGSRFLILILKKRNPGTTQLHVNTLRHPKACSYQISCAKTETDAIHCVSAGVNRSLLSAPS